MVNIKFNQGTGMKVQLILSDTESDLISFLKEKTSFTAKAGELYYLPGQEESVLLASLGEKDKVDAEALRLAAFKIAKSLESNKVSEASLDLIDLTLPQEEVLAALIEGFIHSEYEFTYSTKNDKDEKKDLAVSINNVEVDGEAILTSVRNIMEAVFLTRDLANLTSNYLHPEDLANKAVEVLEPLGVKVTVFNDKQMLEMGMEAAYSVGKGSDFGPRFIVMEYNGDESTKDRIALIGKAICYDSGGYSLKPSRSMSTMQSDMAGAATVLSAIMALAKNQVKTNVIGAFAACENVVSGRSYRVGDIISSLSGQTIEVDNTDAEGRVSLADSIYYASSQENVTRVIDIATLTGACISALGQEYTGAISNNQEFYEEFVAAADAAGEKVWQLPIDDEFKNANKSKVADFINSAPGGAGTVTAGLFCGEFLANKELPWIHLDIAGTSWRSAAKNYLPERATGYHVKAFYNLLANEK